MNLKNGTTTSVLDMRGWKVALLLLLVAMAMHAFTLLNPGFFNHDEWQRLDHIRLHGFADYVVQYGAVKSGPDFGTPVRPIGFLHQGVASLFMQNQPFIAHLMDVLLHVFCALALWWMLQQSPLRGRHALIAALVFVVSPLAAFSTAWVGASFDRFYILFALLAGAGMLRIVYRGANWADAVLLAIGCTGAMLSKETAIMLPSALLLGLLAVRLHDARRVRLISAFGILGLACIPVLVYLAIRFPALQASFGGKAGAYDPTKGDFGTNAYLYFAQPFLINAVELVSAVFIPKWIWFCAAALHGMMVFGLMLRRGIGAGLLYLAGYFVFLLPVMPVSIVGAHYLYGSGVAFSIGMALLLPPPASSKAWMDKVLVGLFSVLMLLAVAHTLKIGREMYVAGACQRTFLTDLDAQIALAHREGATAIRVVPEPGAKGYVALRSTFGRFPYQAEHGMPVSVDESGAEDVQSGTLTLDMAVECGVKRR
jgi:hypothetical protein